MLQCCKESEEKAESISYKRALAMMYKTSCKGPAAADVVDEWVASLVKRDMGVTKMCLALIQAATAARSVGVHVVSCVEAAEVKKHIERMQDRQHFYMSGQSNQEGGAV